MKVAHHTVGEVEKILELGMSISEQSMIVTNLKKMIANLSKSGDDENIKD